MRLFVLKTGDYSMNVYFCKQLLKRCPVIGSVIQISDPLPPAPAEPPTIPPPTIPTQPPPTHPEVPSPVCAPHNVILSGAGLTNARVHEQAEFIMDGSNAGPGKQLYSVFGVV